MNLITIDEYRTAEKFFREKMSGHWTRPLAEVAMVAAVRFLLMIGKPERDVRAMFEKTVHSMKDKKLEMPTAAEAIRMTGQE